MNYLNRVVRRAGASSAPFGEIKARVERAAVASKSPLADIDQRLHLEPFSEYSNLAISAANTLEIAAQSGEIADNSKPAIANENEPLQTPSGLLGSESNDDALPRTTPVAIRDLSNTKGHSELDLGAVSSQLSDAADQLQNTEHDVSKAVSAKDASKERPGTSNQSQSYTTKMPAYGVGSRSHSENYPADDTATATPSLQESLLLAQRWVEGGLTPESTQGSQEPPLTRQAPIDQSHKAASNVSDQFSSSPLSPDAKSGGVIGHQRKSPLTRVEIGSIEVEVVAPAKPAVQPVRPTAAQPASHASSRATPFGWRQR